MITLEEMPDAPKLFLTREKGKIRRGEYDKFLTVPFASKALLFAVMCEEVEKRIKKHINPLLSEEDILNCIETTKIVAASTAGIFLKTGILEKTEEGIKLSEKGKKVILQ
ncbi:MAG: hypothetical protein RSE41_07665 [Clostridia bacterium]